MTTQQTATRQETLSRRRLFGTVGALTSAAVVGGCTAGSTSGATASSSTSAYGSGSATVDFHGEHQAGILTTPPAYLALAAFDLHPGSTAADLRRVLRLWTGSARRLAAGTPALADTEPELATSPDRLTATIGIGRGAITTTKLAVQTPTWLAPLPAYRIDKLQPRWTGGDLVVQLCADTAMPVSHALRVLAKDVEPYATLRWQQRGFRTAPDGTRNRNLFGQVDGTINPAGADAEKLVWITDGPEWLRGGTSMVVRRIAMNLTAWDKVDRPGREAVIGRDLASGTPLTGGGPADAVNLTALDATGLPTIAAAAHTRRAMTGHKAELIVRRPYNYDDPPAPGQISDAGLVFISFQADVAGQYLPIQRRLAELDLLNTWTTPIGSAVFAILPGLRADASPGAFLGEALFS